MKIVNLKDHSYQLEDGLWYEDIENSWGGVCPKCGEVDATIYYTGLMEWKACAPCKIKWQICDNLFSVWKEMFDAGLYPYPDRDISLLNSLDGDLELLAEFEDAEDIYAASPLHEKLENRNNLQKEVSLQRQTRKQ